ncbi:MAG TPA: CHAD domain-containing protein [Vicinamibacterales bacterium]|nr:CHAD domain-containing protein [Vicinamibacterales bacterium]
MGFCLKPGQPIDEEIRRIADHQFAQAVAALRTVGGAESDDAVHAARRRVKKVRALIRLVRPTLSPRYRSLNRRLRAVNRLLAPVADGHATVETLERLAAKYRRALAPQTLAEIRRRLLRREAVADEEASLSGAVQTAAALLCKERRALGRWRLDQSGFRAIAPGLGKSVRSSRRAMALALAHPSIEHYHTWRQRVKDQWLHVRLLQARCANGLARDERRLEALDGCLGEYHDCALLQNVLTSDSALDRSDAARCLRLVRRYQRELRAKARTLGRAIHRETPRRFVKRVKRHWRSARRARGAAERSTSWQRAA